MNRASEAESSNRGARYPIRTVSELTGVNAITLRAWESRHGLIEPVRKSSGHRLYTQEHIDLINQIVGLLDRGMRISQVKPFLDDKQSELDESGEAGETDSWQTALDGMLAGVIRFDEPAIDAVYNASLARHDIRTVINRLLFPLLKRLGDRWASGLGTIAEEHFFGFYMRNKLGAQFHHRSQRVNGPRLLLACLPGERHEFGILLFALAVSEAGYMPIVLGADMPLAEIPAAITKTKSLAVVLSSMISPKPELIRAELSELVSRTSVPVFLGGRATVDLANELRKIDVTLLGTDVGIGIARMEEVLGINKHL